MVATCQKLIFFTGLLAITSTQKLSAQTRSSDRFSNYTRVNIYLNPDLEDDHSNQSFSKVDNDFFLAQLTTKRLPHKNRYFAPYNDGDLPVQPDAQCGNYQMTHQRTR